MTDISNFDEEFKSEMIVHKRRSSIFHTQRNITCDEDIDKVTINKNGSISSKNEEYDTKNNIKSFNLKEYVEKLKQERKNWQQEYKNRKIQRRNLDKQKANAERQGQLLDLNVLTKAERNFVLSRPNYEYICKNNQKLLDVALKISIHNQRISKFNLELMKKIKNKISEDTINIIKMSNE